MQVSVPMLMRVPSCQKAYGELELRNTVSLDMMPKVAFVQSAFERERIKGNEIIWWPFAIAYLVVLPNAHVQRIRVF